MTFLIDWTANFSRYICMFNVQCISFVLCSYMNFMELVNHNISGQNTFLNLTIVKTYYYLSTKFSLNIIRFPFWKLLAITNKLHQLQNESVQTWSNVQISTLWQKQLIMINIYETFISYENHLPIVIVHCITHFIL